MEFQEYCKGKDYSLILKTEQSETFLFDGEVKTICKTFKHGSDKIREEFVQKYLWDSGILNVPRILDSGEDFIEMEFIERMRDPSSKEIIRNISNLYIQTLDGPIHIFRNVDLSREKIFHRLSYLPEEFERAKINEDGLLERAKIFADQDYHPSDHKCLVHGDLKSAHCFPSKKGLFFIDFGLTAIASPWYDLAFLYLEKKDKKGELETIATNAYGALSNDFEIGFEECINYLKSGIFYRALYNLGFALRHRPKSSIERTKRELNEIIQ